MQTGGQLTPAQKIIAKYMTEAELQNNIIALATSLGYLVHAERPAISRRGKWSTPIQGDPGYVDLTLARHGRVIFTELKSENKEVKGEQINWQYELLGRPGVFTWKRHPDYYVWHPSQWVSGEIEQELKRVLEE